MVKTDFALVAVVFPLHLSHLIRGSNTGPQYLGSNYKQAINSHNSVLSGVNAKTNMLIKMLLQAHFTIKYKRRSSTVWQDVGIQFMH